LAAAGYDVVHARDVGLRSAPDSTVLAAALDEGRVLVTLDTDFAAVDLDQGAVVVIGDDRVRIRRLPI
jgi:predicted nuclease of predicted toxin-antitoxin system